jgi:hypothetical protein
MRSYLRLDLAFFLPLLQVGMAHAQDDVAVPATSPSETPTAALATTALAQPGIASPMTPAASTIPTAGNTSAPQKARLDLATPDLPAFTALNVSPTKISTPTNVKDFVAALASGINANGQVQSGVAIEVSPLQLLDNALSSTVSPSWQKYLGGLAVSAATNSLASGAASSMQVAFGARYAYGGYTPTTDNDLASCIKASIAFPVIAKHLDADGKAVDVPPSSDTPDRQKARQDCRDAFKAAHLASSGVQMAYVYSAQATGSSQLADFGTLANTAWISASWGYDTYKIGKPNSPTDWPKTVATSSKNSAIGFQPTVMVRYDGMRLSSISSTQNDLFVGARIPLISTAWSVFVEGGYKKTNLGNLASPPATNTEQVPVGLGADLRLADGTWFGLYAGGDAKSGALLSTGNIKWSLGENRPYSY